MKCVHLEDASWFNQQAYFQKVIEVAQKQRVVPQSSCQRRSKTTRFPTRRGRSTRSCPMLMHHCSHMVLESAKDVDLILFLLTGHCYGKQWKVLSEFLLPKWINTSVRKIYKMHLERSLYIIYIHVSVYIYIHSTHEHPSTLWPVDTWWMLQ